MIASLNRSNRWTSGKIKFGEYQKLEAGILAKREVYRCRNIKNWEYYKKENFTGIGKSKNLNICHKEILGVL